MSDEQAKQFLEQATQSLQSGQYQQALELIDQAIALKEDDSEAHVLRGIALSQLAQPDQATEAFRRAISLSPYNVKAYFNLAVHYFSLGQKAEALEMAREAVRIDAKHSGARDLIARIEGETQAANAFQAPQTPDPSRIGDPLATPTETPGAQPPGPAGPYQSAPPPTGYHRPGYETSGEHSLQFIANMGKNWDTIGWVLIGIGILIDIFAVVQLASMWDQVMAAMQNPAQAREFQEQMYASNFLGTIMQIFSYLATIGGLVWMILELSDRRGNWLWLLPYFLVCCCTCGMLQPVVMGIYILTGRKK